LLLFFQLHDSYSLYREVDPPVVWTGQTFLLEIRFILLVHNISFFRKE
jgi:hypothetical protein